MFGSNCNIKSYNKSRHARKKKNRRDIKRYFRHNEKKESKRSRKQLLKCDIKRGLDHELDTHYNILFLNRFSNINVNHIHPIHHNDTRSTMRVHTDKYNRYDNDKRSNIKALKRMCHNYGYDPIYDAIDDVHCNFKQLHKVYNIEGYHHYNDTYNWHKEKTLKPHPKPRYIIDQQIIEHRCNWSNCQLITYENRHRKLKLLLYLNNKYHLWINADYYVLLNHPVWFKHWVASEISHIPKRYRNECYQHMIPNHPNTLPIICKTCNKYCCARDECCYLNECATCSAKKEYDLIRDSVMSVLEVCNIQMDALVAHILTEYCMGMIRSCQNPRCRNEWSTSSKYEYMCCLKTHTYTTQTSFHDILLCDDCMYFGYANTLSWNEATWTDNGWTNERASIRKRRYKYNGRGFYLWRNTQSLHLPIVSHKRYKGRRATRVVQNALFINNFSIMDKYCHLNLTQIMLQYGDLKRDVFINLDRNKEPYAIVQFVRDEDARHCKLNLTCFGKDTLNIEWVDRSIDECEFEVEDECVTNAIDGRAMIHDGNVKAYSTSKRNRVCKKIQMEKRKVKQWRHRKKRYFDKRVNDKRSNRKSKKRLVREIVKLSKVKNYGWLLVNL